MDISSLRDPVFIAKVIDFIIFVGAVVFAYLRWGNPWLVGRQEAQNKAVADAEAELARAQALIEAARRAIQQAELDSIRMVEVGKAQAQRVIVEDRFAAQEHAQRILAHAGGELDRERYRVRRELLEETVERATHAARGIVQRDLTPAKQNELVQSVLASLEAEHA
jgi:F0F1-type ATP synthase membrane subunit b/b'